MAENSALKKLNKKIDGLPIDKELSSELKADLKELFANNNSASIENQLEQLNSKLELIDSNNSSLKDSIHDFVKATSKTLETITKSESDDVPERLKEYLLEIVGKIEGIKTSISNSSFADGSEDIQLKNIKQELSFFQNELETTLNKQLSEIDENIGDVASDIKNKLDVFKDAIDNHTEKLMMEIISDVKQLKSDTLELSGNIKKFDEKAVSLKENTVNQIVENANSANEKVINELAEIKKVTAKAEEVENTNKESVEILKHELSVLKNNIHGQIRDVLSKILVQDEIKFLCEEAISGIKNGNTEIGVVRKHLKDLKIGDEKQALIFAEMRNIVAELGNYGLSESSDKIDMIYDNLSMVNTWASSSDAVSQGFEDLCKDFELTADKVDIIYENLTFINEWVKTLDKFSKDIEELRNNCRGEIDLPQKIDDIYANISAVREWSKKADALALQVKALSVQISETESSVNAQNLNEMKRLFVEMNDNISDMNTRTNKMIIESDKSSEIMKGHLKDFQSLISDFTQKSESLGIDDLSRKVDEIKDYSVKNSEFEGVVTESFAYLAEWIDAAGSAINSIKGDIAKLQETSENRFESIETVINTPPVENPVVPHILLELQNISEYLEKKQKQEEEKALEEQPEPQPVQEVDYEGMKNLLEYIAAQVASQPDKTEENERIDVLSQRVDAIAQRVDTVSQKFDNISQKVDDASQRIDIVSQRIESFENKISSFERYMSKLIDYLEED